MRVVTWNINSVRLRINSVKKVVKKLNPDILCLQETKCLKEDFPFEDYEWIDLVNGIEIRLFSNRILIFKDEIQKGISLFDVPETKELYLVQDLKEVDYIVKIDSGIEANMMIKKIESIDQISYLYLIDQSRLSIDPNLNTY